MDQAVSYADLSPTLSGVVIDKRGGPAVHLLPCKSLFVEGGLDGGRRREEINQPIAGRRGQLCLQGPTPQSKVPGGEPQAGPTHLRARLNGCVSTAILNICTSFQYTGATLKQHCAKLQDKQTKLKVNKKLVAPNDRRTPHFIPLLQQRKVIEDALASGHTGITNLHV